MAKTLKEKVVDVFKKEVKKEPVVAEVKSGFDPSVPENKQREYR